MSCCPPAPEIKTGGSSEIQTDIADNQILPGESTECYMQTASNPTGRHDDATDNVPNKIDPPTIAPNSDGTIDVTFKLQQVTPASAQRTPTTWEIKDDSGGTPAWYNPSGATNPVKADSLSGATMRLRGKFRAEDFGKQLRVSIIAKDAQGVIDNRGYVFSPAATTPEDSIQFLHPLPGAVVTSRFNPTRMHPVLKIIKPHNGADFALPGRKIGDVLAAADGEVIFTGFETRAGNYIKIKHANSAGKHLCTTVYMHLAKFYVQSGQKVSAGQKIGLEGSTGVGTNAHLHFECRLPNGMFLDPVPLIRGTLQVAQQTNPDNTAKEGTLETQTGTSALTPENVDAKQAGCKPFGPEYPSPASPVGTPPAAPNSSPTDPFEKAWDLTLKNEVIGWAATPPTVQTTIDGIIIGSTDAETKTLRRNVGFVVHPDNSGGATKFGIAQKYNKNMKIDDITYAQARDAAYAGFWNGKLAGQTAAAGKPKTAVAMFDISFLCGEGGLSAIARDANINGLDDTAAVDALCNAYKNYLYARIADSPSKEVYRAGWTARVERVRAVAKGA